MAWAGIVAGGVFGLVNAFLVVRLGLNPFLATLASGTALRGFCYLLSETANTGSRSMMRSCSRRLGHPCERTVPYVFLLLVAITPRSDLDHERNVLRSIAHHRRWRKRRGGAIGAIRPIGRSDLVHASGTFAGVAGVLLASRIGTGLPAAAFGQELTLFSAVLLGGTALWGGRSNVVGSVAAVLFITILYTGVIC